MILGHPKILSELFSAKWAITPAAFRGILKAVQREITEEDRKIFHKASAETKKAFVATLGAPVEGLREVFVNGKIGSFFMDGPIIPRADFFSEISGMVSVERLTTNLKALQDDRRVETIVMLVDSPGGFITGVSEFAQLLKESEKPVIAFAYGSADSAAYWISTGASQFYAADTADVGSIGVLTTFIDDSKQMEEMGLEEIEIVSSQSPDKRPDITTAEGRDVVQKVVDSLADVFIDTVAENRGVSRDTVLSDFGQGSVLIGKDAAEIKMIDGVLTLESLFSQLSADEKNIILSVNKINSKSEAKKMSKPENKASEENTNTPETTPTVSAADAQKAERERIQGIESIMDTLGDASASVKAAARKVIDENKFNADATKDSVASLVLGAVVTAQKAETAKVETPAKELAKAAENIPDASNSKGEEEDLDQTEKKAEESKQRVSGIGAGMKNTP